MNKDARIYVAGHTGLVGSALVRKLRSKGYNNLVFSPYPQYDLVNQKTVEDFFKKEKPEYVFLAAAKVGGIVANNTYRGQFIYENLMIQSNIIHYSKVFDVKKLLFLGSSCIYPKNCPQPIKENYLLTEVLEYTNEPYAIAKIAGIKLCESYNLQYGTNFISIMPTNLYGENDNFDLETSHVLPAIIRKMHLGKCLQTYDWDNIRADLKRKPIENVTGKSSIEEIIGVLTKYGITIKNGVTSVELWGTGTPKREFMNSDDLSEACLFVMDNINFNDIIRNDFNLKYIDNPHLRNEIRNTHINIGTGEDLTIAELAEMIKSIVGFTGEIIWNTGKPDGTSQKLLDVSKINKLGWKAQIPLKEGIQRMYQQYLE